MLTHRIGLVSRATNVDFATVVKVAAAINLQLVRDLAPLWNLAAVVVPLESADRLDPGLTPVLVVDDPKAAGFRLGVHNQPYAQVAAGGTWSLAASHEILELVVDPSGNRLVAAPGLRIVGAEAVDTDTIVEYLVEVCGPGMDPAGAYLIDGLLVADFCTPHYFDVAGGGARYSFSGRLKRPRHVPPNGRLTWLDPSTGRLMRLQHGSSCEIVELVSADASGSLTDGLALRTFADRQSKGAPALNGLAPAEKVMQRRDVQQASLGRSGVVRARWFGAAAGAAVGAATPASSVTAERSALPSPAGRPAAGPAPIRSPGAAGAPAGASARIAAANGPARRWTDIPTGPVDPGRSRGGDRRRNNQYEAVRTAIFSNAVALTLPGILSVRPGLHFGAEGFTNERVVVVKVHPAQLDEVAALIAPEYGDIRVEVRPADTLERLRVKGGAAYLQVAAARHELRAPVFEDALYLDGAGTTVDDTNIAAASMVGHAAKRQIAYAPPADATLDAFEEPVRLLLHVSPDAGWAELSKFLANNPGTLVVGMYDLGAAHVLDALKASVAGGRKLTMTLDRPAPMASSDQSSDSARQTLARDLGSNFDGAAALTNADARSSTWIYPNAYHAKVAVRDDDRVWLSSGDWNNSSFPKMDLADLEQAGRVAARSDRDWHVVVINKRLADTFRTFLAHDHAVALADEARSATASSVGNAGAAAALPPVRVDTFSNGLVPNRFFPPKAITVTARVQPLMTPDNYQPRVLELIDSATASLYLQTQYIHPSGKRGDEDYDALVAALARRIAAGLDVRLIMSAYQTDDWMEKLVMQGIPSSVVRRQPGAHSNGMIVDHARVLIGSHNWSADGALRNRDAGLIVHDATAAAYFGEVFLHDWEHLAQPVVGT